MTLLSVCFSLICIIVALHKVTGHGRLLSPPSRSSMWREGFKTPVNYNDHELFCGGFNHQVNQGYKCGVCGDPYDRPRPRDNEAGGKYGKGIISRRYKQGQVVTVKVQITAQHKGYFEFRICPTNNPKKYATHECLNRNVLQLANGSGTRFGPIVQTKTYSLDVRLPPHLTCTHCVFQWKYHAGNSWGEDANGRGCVGCGPQEEFYGCADVAVLADGPVTPTEGGLSRATPTEPSTERKTSRFTPTEPSTERKSSRFTPTEPRTERKSSTRSLVLTTKMTPPHTRPSGRTSCKKYQGVPPYHNYPGIADWCMTNCRHSPPFCPNSHCKCVSAGSNEKSLSKILKPESTVLIPVRLPSCKEYKGAGLYAHVSGMSDWCTRNCNHKPPNCPASHCKCVTEPSTILRLQDHGNTNLHSNANCKQFKGSVPYRNVPGINEWCTESCRQDIQLCPKSHCECAADEGPESLGSSNEGPESLGSSNADPGSYGGLLSGGSITYAYTTAVVTLAFCLSVIQ